MPTTKDKRFYGNAQRARAHDAAASMPAPRPMRKDRPDSDSGDHGGVAKVETIVHHQDGHKERQAHGSAGEAADHLQSLEAEPLDLEDAKGEEPCPDCDGHDPNCPTCGGTGMVPKSDHDQDDAGASY